MTGDDKLSIDFFLICTNNLTVLEQAQLMVALKEFAVTKLPKDKILNVWVHDKSNLIKINDE
jgi:hypothetical protein